MSLLEELTEGLPRQGPGSTEATLRALAMTSGLAPHPRILDVGCGTGAQTIVLAQATRGEIVALDLSGRFLTELSERARAAGVADRITTIKQSMFAMDFPADSFDLIWSEGAIYIMGFASGLAACRRFLKPGGWMAVSELSWIVPAPPKEPREYWASHYPGMRSREQNCEIAAQAGYRDLQTFVLPPQDWWKNYYGPGEARLLELRSKYAGDPRTSAPLDDIQREYDLFRAYSDFYGYVFYVMRKPAR
ncbi:MAG TPA: class I SAM-dependent methyltransferase [Candidatus Binataceae bacterium]|nr:class I SAM-dependent methyltransferase [Candidatus Binataceae bacterium]